MTDNDRMDRAKRIRQMREGGRDDGEQTPSEETDTEDATATSSAETSTDDSTETPSSETSADDATAASSAETSTEAERADGGGPEKQTMADIAETKADSAEKEADTADESDSAGVVDAETTAVSASDETGDSVSGAADAAGDSAGAAATADQSESSDESVNAPLPEMDELEAALESSDATADPASAGPSLSEGGAAGAAGTAAAQTAEAESTEEEETRVLEFTLDDEHYCLDIEYIEEIVKHENITRVPNTPAHVEGVVDLRGQITTILNPKVTIGKENDEAGELIVVFDSEAFEDQGHIGWIVDDVRQVSPIVESEVNDPPMAEDYINGVIDREDDDEFVIWTSPELAFEDDD